MYSIKDVELFCKLLPKFGVDINEKYENGKTLLQIAIENDDLELVKSLISQPNFNINIEFEFPHNEGKLYRSPLLLAYIKSNLDIFKILASSNNIDTNFGYRLELKDSDIKIIGLLPHIMVDQSNEYDLTENNLHLEMFKFLFSKYGNKINVVDKTNYNNSLLHNITSKLIERIKSTEGKQQKDSHTDDMDRRFKMFELLTTNEENKNLKNKKDQTPPHLAVEHNTIKTLINESLKVIESLITKENINLQDNSGKTALHYAAENENLEVIKLLLSKCAKTDIKDNSRRTPLDILKKTRNEEIRSYLKEAELGNKNENCLIF